MTKKDKELKKESLLRSLEFHANNHLMNATRLEEMLKCEELTIKERLEIFNKSQLEMGFYYELETLRQHYYELFKELENEG